MHLTFIDFPRVLENNWWIALVVSQNIRCHAGSDPIIRWQLDYARLLLITNKQFYLRVAALRVGQTDGEVSRDRVKLTDVYCEAQFRFEGKRRRCKNIFPYAMCVRTVVHWRVESTHLLRQTPNCIPAPNCACSKISKWPCHNICLASHTTLPGCLHDVTRQGWDGEGCSSWRHTTRVGWKGVLVIFARAL